MKEEKLDPKISTILEVFVVLFISTIIFLIIIKNVKNNIKEEYRIVNIEEFREEEIFDRMAIYLDLKTDKNPDENIPKQYFKGGLLDSDEVSQITNIIKKADTLEINSKPYLPYYFCFRTGKDFICLRVNIIPEDNLIIGENWKSKEAYEFLKKRVSIFEFKDSNEPFSEPIEIPEVNSM